MRLHHWQIQFEAFAKARSAIPFAWGSNDCCTFSADCVQSLTGTDCALSMRGHTTAKQAYRALEQHGGIVGIATKALGEPISAMFAQTGDVVLSSAGKRQMLAICNGGTLLAPGPDGLVSVALDTSSLCWRVA